jgi:hypothetical protein
LLTGPDDVLAERDELFAAELWSLFVFESFQTLLNQLRQRAERDALLQTHEVERNDPIFQHRGEL